MGDGRFFQFWTSEAIKLLSEIKIWLTIIILYYFCNQRLSPLKCCSIFIISFGYLTSIYKYLHSSIRTGQHMYYSTFATPIPKLFLESPHHLPRAIYKYIWFVWDRLNELFRTQDPREECSNCSIRIIIASPVKNYYTNYYY